MTFPKNKLNNPYYFIKNNIVYEISDKQDADNCGQHYVTYQVTSLTDEDKVFVKKGDKYLDVHGTPTVAPIDGYYQVSTGKLDIEANKEVFPWICVKYKENADSETVKEEYLWLDYMIDDGDTFDGTKFVMNTTHAPEEGSYVEAYKEAILAQIGLYFANGYTEEDIKRNFPEYLFAEENDKITVNNKKVYFVDVTTSADGVEMNISGEDMLDAFYKYCNEQVVAYANRLLKRVEKKLDGTTDEEIPVIVSKDTVVDIENDEDEGGGDGGEVTRYYTITTPGRIQHGTLKVAGCDDLTQIPEGTHITVTAIPDNGYTVGMLRVGGNDVESPYEFDIYANVGIMVDFVSTTVHS